MLSVLADVHQVTKSVTPPEVVHDEGGLRRSGCHCCGRQEVPAVFVTVTELAQCTLE